MSRLVLGLAMFLSLVGTLHAQGRKFALLVGVDRYPSSGNFRPLPFTATDIDSFADILIKSGFDEKDVVVMTLDRGHADSRFLPTAAQINQEIEAMLGLLREGDTAVFAFSGHGLLLPVKRMVTGDEGQEVEQIVRESFFCPVDADSRAEDLTRFVAIDQLHKRLEVLGEKQSGVNLLIVDACRAKPLIREQSGPTIQLRPPKNAKAVMALYSCEEEQVSLEDEDLGHGVFFHFLIDGCAGKADSDHDGVVTLPELAAHVTNEVPVYVRRSFGQSQNPEVFVDKLQRIPFVAVARKIPELLTAPFTESEGKAAQTAWAQYLGTERLKQRTACR
ncbi:MAG: caspase family protein [Pirellulaceae bacterium]